MTDMILLNAKTKPALRWEPPASFAFLRDQPLLPVQANEAGRLASSLPLAIVKDAAQPSGWAVVAVCGQAADKNAMIAHDGKWLASAVPECIRYLPFSMKAISGGKGLAAIDPRYARHVLAQGLDGVPLYDDDAKLHSIAQKRVDFLAAYQPRIRRTQDILAALDKAGVIGPWPEAAIKVGGITLQGLHTINEKALHALDDDAFLALRKGGALAVAYSCLLSLYQARNLAAPTAATMSGSSGAVQTTGDLDLEFLSDSDTIKFGPLH